MESRYSQAASGVEVKRGRPSRLQYLAPAGLGELLGRSKVRVSPVAARQGLDEERVARCLRAARGLLSAGWIESVPWSEDGKRFSLVGAVKSGVNDPLGSRYALLLLESVLGEGDLSRWARNPVRTLRQVLAAIDDSLEALAPPKKEQRGGWRISNGPVRRSH